MNRIAAWLRARLPELFGIDLRSLALFRVALAGVTTFDLCRRLADVRAFYTDFGVLPRSWLAETSETWRLSLHLVNGETWFQGLLIGIQIVLALMVVIGLRTRLAAVGTFILLLSLQNRNPLILTGADNLQMCLWFWALFLPIGARWSVDAALSTREPPAVTLHRSWGSAGLLLQVLSVYFFGAILKSGADWWPDGTAVWYALSLDRYVTPLGAGLRELPAPALLSGLTYFVYFLEWTAPLLAFSPVLPRASRFAVMAALMLMHIGFALCLEIGHFPFVALAGLTSLLGGWWWDRAARTLDHGRSLRIFYDRDCGFCLKSCVLLRHFLVAPRTTIAPAQDSARARALMQAQYSWVVIDSDDIAHTRWNAWVAILRQSLLFGWTWRLAALPLWERPGNAFYDWVGRHRAAFGVVFARLLPERAASFETGRGAQWVAAAFVFVLLAWNLASVRWLPPATATPLMPVIRLLRLDQVWGMFAPYPTRSDGWFIAPGRRVDGSEVDVLRPGEPLSFTKPAAIARTHENRFRWRSYHKRVWLRQFANQRLHYARYLCRNWNVNAAPAQRLLSLNIVYMLEISRPRGEAQPIEQRVLWRHQCVPREREQPLDSGVPAPDPEGNEPD